MKKNTALPLLYSVLLSLFLAGNAQAKDFLEKKQVAIGKEVPDFTLPDTTGKEYKLSDLKGKVVMIHFWSANCPFVIRYEERLKEITQDYQEKGVVILGIDSNKTETPEDIKRQTEERSLLYPVLIDKGFVVADVFGAITTPHVFIIDQSGKLAYEGAVDDQGFGEKNPVNTKYAREVLDALTAGKPSPHTTTKTFGCTVKRA